MARLRDLGRALAALGALIILLIGVPAGLVTSIGWPLPSTVPSWEAVSRALSGGTVDDATILKAVALVVWVAWFQVAGAAVVEGWSLLGQRSARPAPFTLPAVQLAVGRLLSTAVVLAAVFHSRAAIAAPVPLAVSLPRTAPPPIVAEPPPAAAARTGEESVKEWLVHRRETLWGVAERALGDGRRFTEIIELNRGRVQPDGAVFDSAVRPGWVLRLPADAHVEPTPTGSHRVVPGDSLSAIAEARLGEMSRWPELWELNRDRVQTDGDRFTDPDLIRPGWVLRLPHDTPEPAVSAACLPAADTTPTTADPTASVAATTTTSTTTSAPATPPIDAPAVPGSGTDPPDGDWTTNAPTVAGVAGAVVLATGLAMRIRLLRRRQAVRGARACRATSASGSRTEDAVVAAADLPLVRWAGQRLAQLVLHLDRRAVTGAPVAVEVCDTAGVELLWDTPQPDAPAGWTAADGGWAWRAAYDPDAPVPVDALPAAIPALVTIGHREHRQLMIDLEAYGAITVSGADDRVDAFLRSVALELAVGQDLADAYVHAVGVDPGVGHLDRLATTDIDGALRRLDGVRRSVTDALVAAQLDGTFAARAGSATPIEATVVIAHPASASDTARLLRAAPARRGIAVIAAGEHGQAPAHVELRDDGTARIEPLGIVFTPVALPTGSAAELDGLLDALDSTAATPADVHRPVAGDQHGDAAVTAAFSTNGHPPHSGNGDEPAAARDGDPATDTGHTVAEELFPVASDGEGVEPALVVRVLGTPGVPDRPDLGRRELILSVLLACRARPVAASAAQDALWGGKPVEAKTVWNVIGATRKALGDLPDGTPVMPSADRARGTLCVAPGVVTDLAVLRSLVERAREAPSSEAIGLLREGLELVAGPPFDAAGYDWAHRDQDVAEACTLIEHATERLADLALDSGLVEVARDAIVRGLRGLPGNEELYRCRMRVEHHAGNLPGVRAAYEELVTYLADLETEPSLSTTALYEDLVRPVRR